MRPRQLERPFEDDAAARLARFESYWRALLRDGLPPGRREIEPGRIGAALPGAFVLDRAAPGVAVLRVAGQALCEIAGREARGLPLSLLFAPEARPCLAALVARGFAGQPCRVDLVAEGEATRGRVGGLLLLPLRRRADRPPQMVGALLHDLPAGPRRFGLAAQAPPAARPDGPRLRLVVCNDRPPAG